MLIDSKKRQVLLVIVLFGLALLAGATVYLRNLAQLRQNVESTFHSRSELIAAFVAQHRDQIAVLHNLMVEHYQHPFHADEVAGRKWRQYPQRQIWELVNTGDRPVGKLTGNSPLPLTASQQHEITAALSMDSQILAAIQYSHEVAWLYYLSASGFIYLAPEVPVEQFSFSPALFQRDYWRDAGPQTNIERRMVMNGPYRDLAGQGWIFTFSQPVYDGDRFLGVVALDLRIGTLQQITGVGEAIGSTLLISEKGHLVARQGAFEPGAHFPLPGREKLVDWQRDERGGQWLSHPVVEDELWVLHHVPRNALYWAAVRDSTPAWLLLVLFAVLCVFAWRLVKALHQVTCMTQIDPLTQTLNRRGFYAKAEGLLALAGRKHLPVAVLLMDIDFFKKINDTHGHAVGDSVLKQLGGHLLQARRPFDLVCRWGGEEFVVLLVLSNAEDAFAVAERLRHAAQRTCIQPGDLAVTLSGGLVLWQPGEDLDHTLQRADLLLYQAKQNGRNHIECAAAEALGEPREEKLLLPGGHPVNNAST